MIGIVGPTGVGKTEFALRLASEIDSEIINCDSRQIYQGMDIGTAKPTAVMVKSTPHHLFDVCSPEETYDLHKYQVSAKKVIEQVRQRCKIPILVGGSGQYFWSLAENWELSEVKPDRKLRKKLELEVSDKKKLLALTEELRAKAPGIYNNIDISNKRRLIRGVEKMRAGDMSHRTRSSEGKINQCLIIGLTADREFLYNQVDRRADLMINNGWVSETKKLLSQVSSNNKVALSTIGYKEIKFFLEKGISWESCISRIKSRTHSLIRTQYNWFKLCDTRIKWHDIKSLNEESIFNDIRFDLDKLNRY